MVMGQVASQFETKHLFENFGVTVDLANSAYTALQKRRSRPISYYDLSLVDLSMDMFEGFKAYHSIRNDEVVRGDHRSFMILLDKNNVIKENGAVSGGAETDEIRLRILADVKERSCIKVRENLGDKLLTEISYQIKSNFLSKSGKVNQLRTHTRQTIGSDSVQALVEDTTPAWAKLAKSPSSPHILGMDSKSTTSTRTIRSISSKIAGVAVPAEPTPQKDPPSPKGTDPSPPPSESLDGTRKLTLVLQSQKDVIPEAKNEEEKIIPAKGKQRRVGTRPGQRTPQYMQRLMGFENIARAQPTEVRIQTESSEETREKAVIEGLRESEESYKRKSETLEKGSVKSPEETSGEEITVMVVDDDTFSAMMMERFIKGRNKWSYKLAMNGEEAVEEIARNYAKYDVIIMDCEMPRKNGYDATREIRAHEIAVKASARIPIFGVSGNEHPEDRAKALEAGMTKYFTKPIDFSSFLDEVYANATSFKIMKRFG
eukprot:TRINITY_DN3562_c0_g4_i2.p1 TRINITY_DN3562_c0_g4~~TRINITY_DN3562_c0_g4_i2.p1  ORF type:complete len:487 (+),score=91.62 TRINITY_DN3562_c0_g4_i2:126-1586(+)